MADHTGDAEMIATDLLAQAEHDVRTRVGLITTDRALAEATLAEVARQLETLSTANVAGVAWQDYGEIVLCENEAAMIAYSDFIAAEHLQVHTSDPHATAKKLRNYGSLFIGENASVVYSDKCCGTNHTLPTMGAGAYTGGLWVGSYVKICTHQWLDESGGQGCGSPRCSPERERNPGRPSPRSATAPRPHAGTAVSADFRRRSWSRAGKSEADAGPSDRSSARTLRRSGISCASSKALPTICMPIGKPAANPTGRARAGWPVTLKGKVRIAVHFGPLP